MDDNTCWVCGRNSNDISEQLGTTWEPLTDSYIDYRGLLHHIWVCAVCNKIMRRDYE